MKSLSKSYTIYVVFFPSTHGCDRNNPKTIGKRTKRRRRKPHPLQGKHRRRERELDTRAPMKKATDAAFWNSTSMPLVLLDMPSLQEKKKEQTTKRERFLKDDILACVLKLEIS
jgi:hypothetical protein